MSLYDVHHKRIERDCKTCRPFCDHMTREALDIMVTLHGLVNKNYVKAPEEDNFLNDANAVIEELRALAEVLEVRVHG